MPDSSRHRRVRARWRRILATVLTTIWLTAAAVATEAGGEGAEAAPPPAIAAPGAPATDAPTHEAPVSEEPVSEEPAPGTAAGGLRVYLDPATGEITTQPDTEQVRRLDEAMAERLSRRSDDLTPFFLSTGGTGVFLEGRFGSAAVVRRAPDGSLEFGCADHPDAVDGFLHLHPAAPAAPPAAVR